LCPSWFEKRGGKVHERLLGLLMNFHERMLAHGIRRVAR
jgi:hypothetical protein